MSNFEHDTRQPLTTTVAIVTVVAVLVSVLGVSAFMAARHADGPANAMRRVAKSVATSPAYAASAAKSADRARSEHLSSLMAQAGVDGSDAFASTVTEEPTSDESAAADATGLEGPEGPAGIDGADGVDGVDGAEGPPGVDGSVGATGPAGDGLAETEEDGGGLAVISPDGASYRIVVTDRGIWFHGLTTSQFWGDSSHFQPQLLP